MDVRLHHGEGEAQGGRALHSQCMYALTLLERGCAPHTVLKYSSIVVPGSTPSLPSILSWKAGQMK